MGVFVSAIHIYPVKSLAGLALSSVKVAAQGLEGDRMLMVTDESGRFVSQRDLPELSVLRAEPGLGSVRLSAPGKDPIEIDRNADSDPIDVTVWQDSVKALDLGDRVSEWLSNLIGRRLRLVVMSVEEPRKLNENYGKGSVSFADAFPVLLIGRSSLDDLNRRLDQPLPMDRFRPNLVVSGSGPFQEDRWKRVRVGECEIRIVKPCARCVVTTVDQSLGVKAGKEPLKTLAAFRRAEQVIPDQYGNHGLGPNDVLFGQNAIPLNPGTKINVGDRVEVLEEA